MALVENNVSVEGASYGKRTLDLPRVENKGRFNGDMHELIDFLSKLNPLAEEFIPQPHRSSSFIINGNGSFANNSRRVQPSIRSRHHYHQRNETMRSVPSRREDSIVEPDVISTTETTLDQRLDERSLNEDLLRHDNKLHCTLHICSTAYRAIQINPKGEDALPHREKINPTNCTAVKQE